MNLRPLTIFGVVGWIGLFASLFFDLSEAERNRNAPPTAPAPKAPETTTVALQDTAVRVPLPEPVTEDCAGLRAELEELHYRHEVLTLDSVKLALAYTSEVRKNSFLRHFVSDPRLSTFISDPELRDLSSDDFELVEGLVQALGFVPEPWEAKQYVEARKANDKEFAAWSAAFQELEGGMTNPNWPILEEERDQIFARLEEELERIWHDPEIVQKLL